MADTVILKRYEQPQLAYLDLAKLTDEGIEAIVRDDGIVTVMPYLSTAFGGVKLIVHEEDAERARKVLDMNEFDSLKETFDDQIEEQRLCPRCGSADVLQRRSFWSGIILLILFFIPLAVTTKGYVCTKCGNTWKEK